MVEVARELCLQRDSYHGITYVEEGVVVPAKIFEVSR
jgi:hypothetical protein